MTRAISINGLREGRLRLGSVHGGIRRRIDNKAWLLVSNKILYAGGVSNIESFSGGCNTLHTTWCRAQQLPAQLAGGPCNQDFLGQTGFLSPMGAGLTAVGTLD